MLAKDKFSLIALLAPFFGLWALFWMVPLFFSADLALQNPEFSPEYRQEGEANSNLSVVNGYGWLGQEHGKSQNIGGTSQYIGFENFFRVLRDAKFYKALKNTTVYAFGSILIILPFAFLLSICLFQLSRFPRGLLVFCLMIPGLALPGVLSTLFYLFFHGRTGALNQYLVIPLGFEPVNWMMDPDFIMYLLLSYSQFGGGLDW